MRVAVIIAARDLAPFPGGRHRLGPGAEPGGCRCHRVSMTARSMIRPAVIAGFACAQLHALSTPGLGVSGARNLGAHHPRALAADALLFLDGDDWLARTRSPASPPPSATTARPPPPTAPSPSCRRRRLPTSPGRMERRRPSRTTLPHLIRGNLFANGGHVLIRAEAWAAGGALPRGHRLCRGLGVLAAPAPQRPFVAVPGPPTLFVRRRAGSLMHRSATDPDAYRAALAAMAEDAGLRAALGRRRLARLHRQARQEILWTIGRERLRRGAAHSALPLLCRGFFGQWRPQRLAVLAQAAWTARRSAPPPHG